METYESPELAEYAELDRRSEQQSAVLKQMLAQATPQLIRQHGGDIVRGCKELMALSIQSATLLSQLSMKYAHDSDKFTQLLRGAERRLDRQLDELSRMRLSLLSMPMSSADPGVIAQQRAILEAITMAQQSFDHEIDRLYDL